MQIEQQLQLKTKIDIHNVNKYSKLDQEENYDELALTMTRK